MDLLMSEDRGVTYLSLIGQLWEREDVSKLQTRLAELLAAKTLRVVLNLERLTFIGSIGLGGVMRMHSDAQKNGCSFMVYRPLGNVKEAFELAEFPSIMPVLETSADLQAALNPPEVPC